MTSTLSLRATGRARLGRRTSLGLGLASLFGAAALLGGGCAQQTVEVPTRALERSGRVSFVCLDDPSKGSVVLPITDCTNAQVSEITDYAIVDETTEESKPTPHLYALVTQTTRGEVAVIDTTARNKSVLDEDPSVPGANFLPIGALPIDIVSTPGSIATFVGVADVGREAIYALPSSRIRPATSCPPGAEDTIDPEVDPWSPCAKGAAERVPAEMSSWPACSLPAEPGQMLLIEDPLVNGQERASCDEPYGADTTPHPNGDLSVEGQGRYKLVVAMPTLGGVAVFDAQSILDIEPTQAFPPCPIERWLPFDAELPEFSAPPPSTGPTCVSPTVTAPAYASAYTPRPTSISYADGRLYASDLDAPLIHVVDMPTPCDPVEIEPLYPYSAENPERVITTTRVAVSPTQTPDLSRFLYAIDALDGSIMAFDVGDAQVSRFPIVRPHPEWNPFSPRDRIQVRAPANDLLIVQKDRPENNPVTGVAASGIYCDPDPALKTADCTNNKVSCNPATLYRTSSDYVTGAAPLKLRGTFGFLSLTSGQVAVVDIDDLDAPCRIPSKYSTLAGCFEPKYQPGEPLACDPRQLPRDQNCFQSSDEVSCNMVLPHTLRSGTFMTSQSTVNSIVPGLATFPLLYAPDGSSIPLDIEEGSLRNPNPLAPQMVVPFTQDGAEPPLSILTSQAATIDPQTGGLLVDTERKHGVAMNFEDPRAHVEQSWSVTWEGSLPGFGDKRGALRLDGTPDDGLYDPNSRFCDFGVQSEAMMLAELAAEKGTTQDAVADEAATLADYVQIYTDLPGEKDVYWEHLDAACGAEFGNTNPFDECRAVFGALDAPAVGRNLRITEAYQDHVLVEPRGRDSAAIPKGCDPNSDPLKCHDFTAIVRCCFPTEATFRVRTGNQWAVVGNSSGFLHHIIPDPATGACRASCDPVKARFNGRVRNTPKNEAPLRDGDPRVLINPMFRFGVIVNEDKDAQGQARLVLPAVDTQFVFSTQGFFTPLFTALAPDETTLIQPAGMSFIPATGEIAVTDGSINGLTIIGPSGVTVSRRYY